MRKSGIRFSLQIIEILMIGIGSALAHSWYPQECCSDRDCFPVPAGEVKTTPQGYILRDGTRIEFRDARPSPDGKFHICRRDDGKGAMIRIHEKPACFWAPIGAS